MSTTVIQQPLVRAAVGLCHANIAVVSFTLILYTAAWLEPQPSSEAQIKPEQTEDGSDSSSSSGSIEVPIARSRLLQLSRSNDLDGTTSSRRV